MPGAISSARAIHPFRGDRALPLGVQAPIRRWETGGVRIVEGRVEQGDGLMSGRTVRLDGSGTWGDGQGGGLVL